MNTTIGEIKNAAGKSLLRMWDGKVSGGPRPFRRHLHTAFEIACINRGEGVYVLKDGECRFCEGDIFIFPPNVFHCITNVESDTLEFTNIHFQPYFLENDADICYAHSQSFCNRITGDRQLYDLFAAIRREVETGHSHFELTVRSLINIILVRLLREYAFADNRVEGSLRAAVRYIDENYTSQITLDDIAAAAGLTPTYFSGRFKEIYGIPPWEYITDKRIERSIRLLRQEEGMNILDIALACGFNNTANFNKMFKKSTGMTPSYVRRVSDIII